MTGNRSLDEFAGDDRASEVAGDGVDTASDAVESAVNRDQQSEAEPVIPTYGWSPDGEPCSACGTVVERRWRDGDLLVCETCKAW